VRVLQSLPEGGVRWISEPDASQSYGGLKVPQAPGFEVRSFGHDEHRREVREEITVVLAIGHAPRAHEVLSCSDALSGFLEVIARSTS
jgi:hypothetical protein